MKVTDIIAKRESLTLPVNEVEETHTYLSLYNQDNELIKRSKRSHSEGIIRVEHEGLEFVSFHGDEVFITLNSLKKFISK